MSLIFLKIWLSAILPVWLFSKAVREHEPVIWHLHVLSCWVLVIGFVCWVTSLIWLITF